MANGIGTLPAEALAYLKTLEALQGDPRLKQATDMEAVRKREAELAEYLGQTDYAGQLGEASQMAKLQLGLALASRGFGAMGAQPRPGEMAISTLGREMLAPLGADAMTVAQQLYQQKLAAQQAKRQEEQRIKLAALEAVEGKEAEDRALALKLMPDPKTTKLLADPYVVVSRGEDGDLSLVKEPGGNAAIQVRQLSGSPKIIDIKTGDAHTLLRDQEIMKLSEYAKSGESKGKAANVGYMQHKTTNEYIHVGRQGPNEKAFNTLTGNLIENPEDWTWVGSTIPKSTGTDKPTVVDMGLAREWIEDPADPAKLIPGPPKETKGLLIDGVLRQVVPSEDGTQNVFIKIGSEKGDFAMYERPTGGDGVTDAERAAEGRLGALYSQMNQIQVGQLEPDFSPYSARSALYFDQSAYLSGDFAFKYIPPGTPVGDRSKDVTITNENVKKLITNKMKYLAHELRTDFGDVNQTIKSERIAKAVKKMLSVTPSTLFGAAAIEDIGTDVNDNLVGYTPDEAAFSPAISNVNAETAARVMREDSTANAVATYRPLPIPYTREGLNKTWGRMRVATEVFPNAFSNTGEAGTDLYDSQLVQNRLDIEDVLLTATLNPEASLTDHRAVIQGLASARADARNKSQQSSAANDAHQMYIQRLEFRQALLDFKNAAAEAGNIEGFITGTIAGGLARIGLADWIADEGAEHWNRLSIASERFQEGQSRRVGVEFGDNRISNYDAQAYQKLVADISSGPKYNKVLIEDGLRRVNRELTGLMSLGGKVGWTKRDLEMAAEAGVDFSDLNTQMNWHGYGYYGESRYPTSRQYTPALSDVRRNDLRTTGELKDTMYGGQYTVPMVNYLTDQLPTFSMGREATGDAAAVKATETKRMGSIQLEYWLQSRAEDAGVSLEEMRRRVVRGIRWHNIWRDTLN